MTDNRTTELLPCPFCGDEASAKVLEYDDDCKVWGVFCESDLQSEYSHGHFVDNYPTEAEAIEAWNTRAGRGECENVAPSYLDFLCSSCGFVHYHSDENDSGDGNEWNYCPNCGAKVVDT